MSGRPSPETDGSLKLRYQSLLALTESITSRTSLSELFKELPGLLRPVVDFDAVAVVLYDAEHNFMRLHVFETTKSLQDTPIAGEGGPVDLSPEGVVWKTQQPMLISPVSKEERFPEYMARIRVEGIQSLYSIPLTASGRRLGAIAFGSSRENAYDEADLEFLRQVAKQVAVAIDSVLNLESAASERDRNRLLLEIGKAVTSNLSLGDLLRTVSSSLRQFIKHDFASVVLSDEDTGQLRVHGLDTPVTGPFAEGTVLPIDGTPVGLAIKTRKTLVRDRIDFEEFYAPQIRVAYSGGLRSGICVPLISHGNVLGGLNIGSTREAAFTADDVKILEEIAGQVAIGVENALNFQRAERERDRKQTLLEINNAISTHLDLADLLRVTSERLRDYFEHDLAGLVLYNQDTDQLVAHTLDLSRDNSTLVEGAPFPIDGTLNGLAFSTRKPVVRHRIDPTETSWALARQFFEEQGLKSYYWMPLVTGGRAVGVLNIGSRKENALSDRDVELLQHIATQIAIAVENSLVYQEITALKNKLASEKLYLEEEIRTEHNFSEIVGESATLKRILQQVATVAPTDSAVLLCGETGTGKELIARAIHDLSSRKERTLVKLNCAAIPTGLLESELFGHEKGAFTGAIAARIGRFELAHKGTLLLDEIGEIPLELQPKLLRVLQEQEFERLGSSRTVKTDVRLIAATNVDLPQMVTEKKFRSDLYYRLNVFPITIPPLRERIGDIPLLVGYFTQKHALRMNKRIHMVAKETIDSLCQYSWPGNVRELENFIERAVILTSGSELQAPLSELSAQVLLNADGHGSATAPAAPTAQPVTMEDVERAHIEEILQRTRGVIGGKGGAAEILGLPISTLRNRMKKLGLK